MNLLDKDKILESIKYKDINIYLVKEINSTNDFFENVLKFSSPSICLAEKQLKGRGRKNKIWIHTPYHNIALSLFYIFNKDVNALSLVAGLAVRNTIAKYINNKNKLKVKWPNDVLYDNKKISGILIENHIINNISYSISGIGLNVHKTEPNPENSISLEEIINAKIDRNKLVTQTIDNIITYYSQFSQTGLNSFREEWNKNNFLAGKTVTVTENQKTFKGQYIGIDKEGKLQLKLSNKTECFACGEASIIF